MTGSFSLYECALALTGAGREPVPELAHLNGREGSGALMRFRSRVPGMLSWCRYHEEKLIADRPTEAHVHAGFERLSRVEPVAGRYRAIADIVLSLVVYGQPDRLPDLRSERVELRQGPLLSEWFLLISSPDYGVLLAARDDDGFNTTKPLRERSFEAFATQDRSLVQTAFLRLLEAYPPSLRVQG